MISNMTRTRAVVSAAVVSFVALLAPSRAAAQFIPFFNNQPTLFSPEIDVVNSGVILDAQPVVSSDMKYVTMNMRVANTELLALRDFAFQVGGNGGNFGGFVGGAGGGGAAAGGAAGGGGEKDNDATLTVKARRGRRARAEAKVGAKRSPSAVRRAAESTVSVLDRPGTTRVDRDGGR